MDKETTNVSWKEGETINWNQLCLVRVYNDVKNQLKKEDGKLWSTSVINSSQGEIPRLTVHWTLNHVVANHFSGNWSNGDLVILAPGKEMVAENGIPENLNAVDTFWAKDMVIPKGSKMLWFGSEPDPEWLNIEGVEHIVFDGGELKKLTQASVENYKRCDKLYSEKKAISFNDFLKAVDEMNYYLQKMKVVVDEKVHGEIRKMGYEVFEGDHGTYMDGPMAGPIYDLAEKEGITSDIHSMTLMGQLEIGEGIFVSPLMQLASESDKELFEVNGDGSNDFINIVKEITRVTNGFKINERKLSAGEENQLLVLATELYNLVRSNEQTLKKNEIRSLRGLLDSARIIRKNWQSWDMGLVEYIYKKEK